MLARIAAPPSRIAVNKSQVVTTAVLSRTYCIDGSFSVAAVQLRWSRPPPQPIRASGGNPSLPRHPVTTPGHQRDTKENLGVTPTESCGDRGISHHNGCGFLGMCPRLSNSVFCHSRHYWDKDRVDSGGQQLRNSGHPPTRTGELVTTD